MFKLLGKRRKTEEQEKVDLEKKDADIVKESSSEEPVTDILDDLANQPEASPAASVRSILKTAIRSADQIVESVKTRAQTEAEEEAAGIIAQARKEAEEIRKGKSIAAKGETEDIPAAVAEPAKEKSEEPAPPSAETAVSEPVAKAAVSKPAAATVEEPSEPKLPRKRPGKEEAEPVSIKPDGQSLYAGEVELAVGTPVDPSIVSKLYNYLQTTPEIKFVRTAGSWNRGTTITVVLDKPIPLVSVISSKIPEARITQERPEKDGFVGERRGVRRINIILKEG